MWGPRSGVIVILSWSLLRLGHWLWEFLENAKMCLLLALTLRVVQEKLRIAGHKPEPMIPKETLIMPEDPEKAMALKLRENLHWFTVHWFRFSLRVDVDR